MRRYAKYLVFIGFPVILFTSCAIFYFNDQSLSLLADSRVRLQSGLRSEVRSKLAQKWPNSNLGEERRISQNDHERWLRRNNITQFHHTYAIIGSSTGRTDQHGDEGVNGSDVKEDMGDVRVDKLKAQEDNLLLRSDKNSLPVNKALPHHVNNNITIGSKVSARNRGLSDLEREKGNRILTQSSLNRSYMYHHGLSLKGAPIQNAQESPFNSDHISPSCSNSLCTEYLSERDTFNFTTCKKRTEATYSKMIAKGSPISPLWSTQLSNRFVNGQLLPSGECRFMNGSGRNPIGLVSFPGSGNTWVRGLLQKATGICTGE